MWRPFLLFAAAGPGQFRTSPGLLQGADGDRSDQHDASLTGLGVMVSTWSEERRAFVLRGYLALTLPFMVVCRWRSEKRETDIQTDREADRQADRQAGTERESAVGG